MDFEELKHKVKLKVDAARYKAERWKAAIEDWAQENPSEAASALVGAITFSGTSLIAIGKYQKKRRDLKKEEDERNSRVWDPEMGIYWETSKPMNQKQKLEYSRRVNSGESRGDVLDSMKLL